MQASRPSFFRAEGSMTMADEPAALRARAEQCRRLAKGVSTSELAHALTVMGADYSRQAAAAEAEEAEAPPTGTEPPPKS
jgi:hypothetical protein